MGLYICIMLGILLFGYCKFRVRRVAVPYQNGAAPQSHIHAPRHGQKKAYIFACLFVFWCLAALKGSSIGSDTASYIRVFESAESGTEFFRWENFETIFQNSSRYETGYVVLNRLLSLVVDDVQWLFVTIATFCILVLYKQIIKDSQDVVLTLFLFVSLRFLYFIMSGMRQAMAIYICILAYKFIKERKILPFVLLVLLASQFHITALLFLAAYPISCLKFNKTSIAAVTIAGCVAFVLFDYLLTGILGVLPEYYSHYTTTERFAENKLGNILVALIQLIFLCVSYFSDYGKEKRSGDGIVWLREYEEASFMKFMMLISFLVSIISLRATTLDRLYYYFWIFSLIYIPNALQQVRSRKNKMVLRRGTIVFTFLYNITLLYFRPEWTNITPFVFFWQD